MIARNGEGYLRMFFYLQSGRVQKMFGIQAGLTLSHNSAFPFWIHWMKVGSHIIIPIRFAMCSQVLLLCSRGDQSKAIGEFSESKQRYDIGLYVSSSLYYFCGLCFHQMYWLHGCMKGTRALLIYDLFIACTWLSVCAHIAMTDHNALEMLVCSKWWNQSYDVHEMVMLPLEILSFKAYALYSQ